MNLSKLSFHNCVQLVSIVMFFKSLNSGCLIKASICLCHIIGSPPVIMKCTSCPFAQVHRFSGVYAVTFFAISSTGSQSTRSLYLELQLALASQPMLTTGNSDMCLMFDISCVL